MPCDYKKYHPAWKHIRIAILRRAKDRCELCGVANHAEVYRHKTFKSLWKDKAYWLPIADDEKWWTLVKIVLTIAHVDQDTKNNNPWNLLALCQRCHNKIDLPWRIRNRRKNHDRAFNNF